MVHRSYPACIPIPDQEAYRNRKEVITQNVLGVANFDLTFAFGLFGREGSAHDSRVFDDSKGRGLTLLPGKYYLGDTGYALMNACNVKQLICYMSRS